MLIDSPQFSCSPTSGQFAKGGAWESAWSFSPDALPSEDAVREYLGGSTEVAFEAFFGPSFFGARMTGQPREVEWFALQCVRALNADRSPRFLTVLYEHLQLPRCQSSVSFAELGCVNAWRSIGTLRIDNLPVALAAFEDTWRAVESSAAFQDTRHDKAMEFAFETPFAHWFGVPVSMPEETTRVSRDVLRDVMRRAGLQAQG
ncbi:hypothetical protein [Acidovorax sp. RAC01]|uniref:hypothetical protein n=1 Tax=Acidovorax sp. RAC01 TaxID=1842533 RepID=UPI00083E8C6C|nr:hypothetical protein [Acidovorax sp. RAC01]AOG21560.1 hypothetical protein BSY15_2799 [Acidovorax sp. RAC01]